MFSVKRNSLLTFLLSELIGAFIFIATSDYPIVKDQPFGTNPSFYPRFLGGCLIFLGLFYLVSEFLENRSSAPEHKARSVPATDVTYLLITGFLLLSVASILAIKYIGFILSGFLLTFFSVLLFKSSFKGRDIVFSLLYSVGLMAVVYVVFEVVVGVQMPRASFFT